jgi:hypothetical protein
MFERDRERRGEFAKVGFKIKRSDEVGGAGTSLILIS